MIAAIREIQRNGNCSMTLIQILLSIDWFNIFEMLERDDQSVTRNIC